MDVKMKAMKLMYKVRNTTVAYSPELCLVGGLVAAVGAAVVFAKAYKSHDDAFEEVKDQIEDARYALDQDSGDNEAVVETNRNSLMEAYGYATVVGIKHYGPTIALTGASAYLILSGYGILKGRNKALISALAVMEQGFRAYRERVQLSHGEEEDLRLFHALDQVEKTVKGKSKDGKTTKKRVKSRHIPEKYNPAVYSRMFDLSNPNYPRDNRPMALFFLESRERWLNDKLEIEGVVLLNDVYKALGFDRTDYGAVMGWSKNHGENIEIKFGLDNTHNKHVGDMRFVLDFNVSGVAFKDFSSFAGMGL